MSSLGQEMHDHGLSAEGRAAVVSDLRVEPPHPEPRLDGERQVRELRALVASMREALEGAQAATDAKLQRAQNNYEAEIKQLKEAVATGRDALEALEQRKSEE